MRLPDRLEYYEDAVSVDGDMSWFPVVTCTVPGCPWWRESSWGEFGDDDDTDWDVIHPAHQPKETPA